DTGGPQKPPAQSPSAPFVRPHTSSTRPQGIDSSTPATEAKCGRKDHGSRTQTAGAAVVRRRDSDCVPGGIDRAGRGDGLADRGRPGAGRPGYRGPQSATRRPGPPVPPGNDTPENRVLAAKRDLLPTPVSSYGKG